jgi:hypothetical protein
VGKELVVRERQIYTFKFIRNDSPEDYKNYFRMSDENLKYLLEKVKPLIVKQDTVMRNAITPERVSQRIFVFSPQYARLKNSRLPRLHHLKPKEVDI